MAATTVTAANIALAYSFFGQKDVAKTLGVICERLDLSGALDLTPPLGYVIGAIHVKQGTLTYGTGSTAIAGSAPINNDTLVVDKWDIYKLTRLVTQAGSAGDYALAFFE